MRRPTRIAATLVCVAGTLVVVGWLIPKFKGEARSGISPAKSELATAKSLLDTFQLNCGRYPTTEEGLHALQVAPKGLEKRWKGPYGSHPVVNDIRDHPYRYTSSDAQQFELVSFGADGQPGGEGDNADMSASG